ncbi:hypothetical protein Tco_1233473 [Tanacetum coccineum]
MTGVSSLIPSSSRIPTILGHVVNLLAIPEIYSTLPIVVTFPLSLVVSILCYLVFLLFGLTYWLTGHVGTLRDPNNDFIFSGGGGNDEGSAAANSVMHASTDDDCGVWC